MSAEASRISADATRQHITLMVKKRDTLATAAQGALEALLPAVARVEWSTTEAIEWWEWSRSLGVPHASRRMCQALGASVTQLQYWKKHPEVETRYAGKFPITAEQRTPKGGAPCVYLLFGPYGECLYIGKSRHVRERLKTHRHEGRIPASSWEIIKCRSDADALSLEGDLIFQHQPFFNRKDRSRRRHVRIVP